MAVQPPAAPPPPSNGAPKGPGAASAQVVQRRHDDDEEHEGGGHDDSNWIISYADMMTLLAVFFILMFSMSTPNLKKMEEMKKATVEAFGGHYKEPHEKLADQFRKVIKEAGLENQVKIESDESGVIATFRGTVFFDSGKSELIDEGAETLRRLAEAVKKAAGDYKIVVEGHTDDNAISSPMFPSNWELSGARASRVIRMFESLGFHENKLTAIGFGSTRPLVQNRDPQGNAIPVNQANNRRVVLRVVKPETAIQ